MELQTTKVYDENTSVGFLPKKVYGENTSVGFLPETKYGENTRTEFLSKKVECNGNW